MTAAALLVVGLAVGAAATWVACAVHYDAQRYSHRLHEQDSHVRGDAAWRLEHHVRWLIDHPGAAVRAHRFATGRLRPRRQQWMRWGPR